jgi:hypothetical protein
MALDEVTAEAVSDSERPLQMDTVADLMVAESRPGERLGTQVDKKYIPIHFGNRQTRTVDSNAFTDFETVRLKIGPNTETASTFGMFLVFDEPPHVFD